ncbi:MAG: hypothetical protein VKK62_00330 [Synechococcaceae cyanobacterium]|nr:hypothetical protein [Synechococcaceae cyanobacterium]
MVNTDLSRLVAAAADLCRKPLRHAVLIVDEGVTPEPTGVDPLDCCLRLEVRSAEGERLPQEDLELELYRSGRELHLTLGWCDERPVLWQGRHPVWMDSRHGERVERPPEGVVLEALARRLRDLLG